MGQYAIKETKELLDLALAGVDCGQNVAADGKVDLNDLAHVLKLVPYVQPGIDKINEVPKELGDLDAQEAADIIAHVSGKLNVTDAKGKIYVAYGLKIIHKAYLIVVDVKNMQKELSAVA